MCNDLIISERFSFNVATIDIEEMKKGLRNVYLGEMTDSRISHKYAKASLCETENEYVETYIEQILSHETIHFVLYDFFLDIDIVKSLDRFDNWSLNPISFHCLHRKTHDRQ